MANFIRAANPIWYMVDLNGLGLNDQYYAFFLNNITGLPQSVFMNPFPSSPEPWPNPLQFQPSGTLPNNLYFNDTETYRIEIRKGPSQSDLLVWLIENFQPAGEAVMPTPETLISLNNIITNSQFSQVSFTGTVTFTSPGVFDVAPGWQLFLSGGGTATVEQIVNLAKVDQANDPPYALRVTTNGTTTAELVQTFNGTGLLFASVTNLQDGYVSGSVTAKGVSGNYPITLNYESDNLTETPIITDTAILNSYSIINGIAKIPVPTLNTSPNDQTEVLFIIVLQNSGTVDVTNVQMTGELVPADTSPPTIPVYQQEPLERQIDHFYHLERQELLLKPIPSYLVGWDFRLNPSQFNGDTVAVQNIGAQKSFYNWDQTIIYQSANTLVSTARGTSDEMVLTMANPGQIAVIQYLSGNILAEILNNRLSVNISAYAEGQNIPITISLWYNTGQSLPLVSAGNNNSIVLTLDSNGKPATFNPCTSLPGPILVNWVEVPRDINNASNATATILTGSNFSDYGLNSWNLDDFSGANSATYFAIVVGTASLNAATKLHISSISLVPGDNPTRPAPQTFDEVLRQCQFYYEKSYPVDVIPGTFFTGNCAQFPVIQATTTGPVGNPIYNAVLDTIQFDYRTKRTTPNFNAYVPQPSPNVPTAGFSVFWWEASGGPHPIGFLYTNQQFAFAWTTNNISTDRYGGKPATKPTWQPNVGPVTTGILDAYVEFQWTLDARLGVV